jgi:hypothetical protein
VDPIKYLDGLYVGNLSVISTNRNVNEFSPSMHISHES